jgi:cyanophycin synthetase
MDPKHQKIIDQKQHNQACVWLEDGQIQLADQGCVNTLISINDIPSTKNGAAKHNVANSMGAAALCYGLGISLADISTGLRNFKGDNNDNPGRGNYFEINGVNVLVDFAHNAHSLTAVIDTVAAMPARRRLIMLGHAGDRTDRDIINLTNVAAQLKPDGVITAELEEYLRGRELGEVPLLIKQQFMKTGFDEQNIRYAQSCLEGAKIALNWAQPGDFVLLLALDQRDDIFEYFDSL